MGVVYDKVKQFKKKYPGAVTWWRLKKHAAVVERHLNPGEEIIFAFKPSIEGETTALYIKKILEGMDIKITKLASGVPIGADMEYVDSLTLERALNDRKIIE